MLLLLLALSPLPPATSQFAQGFAVPLELRHSKMVRSSQSQSDNHTIQIAIKSYATTIGMRPPMRIPNQVNRNIVNAIGGSQRTSFQHMKS